MKPVRQFHVILNYNCSNIFLTILVKMPWTSGPTMYDSVAKEKEKVDYFVQLMLKNANIVSDDKPKYVAQQSSDDFSMFPYYDTAGQLSKPVCTFHFFYLLIYKT